MDFDPAKDAVNIAKHGISLVRWRDMDVLADSVLYDDRKDYGEVRYRAFGRIEGKPYCLSFTIRNNRVRPISLRRAHEKEVKRYVKE